MTKSVFFSFQYEPDNWRVQQVMKIGAISGDSAFTPQDWEAVRRNTDNAIKNWIHRQMRYTSAVIVLVGATLYLLHKRFLLRHSLLTGLQRLTRGQRNDPSPAGTITSTNQ